MFCKHDQATPEFCDRNETSEKAEDILSWMDADTMADLEQLEGTWAGESWPEPPATSFHYSMDTSTSATLFGESSAEFFSDIGGHFNMFLQGNGLSEFENSPRPEEATMSPNISDHTSPSPFGSLSDSLSTQLNFASIDDGSTNLEDRINSKGKARQIELVEDHNTSFRTGPTRPSSFGRPSTEVLVNEGSAFENIKHLRKGPTSRAHRTAIGRSVAHRKQAPLVGNKFVQGNSKPSLRAQVAGFSSNPTIDENSDARENGNTLVPPIPATIPAPIFVPPLEKLLVGIVDLTEFKRLEESREEATAKNFVNDEYIAVWSVENTLPGKRFHVAFAHALHSSHLYKGLAAVGLPLAALIKPPTGGQCIIEVDGERCAYINEGGHYMRHINGHLAKGNGFFTVCPACGSCSRRGDMHKRHARGCSARRGLEFDSLVYDGDQNTFLRLQRTPELEGIWAEQVRQRVANPAQTRFWLPSEVGEYVPTPLDQVPERYRTPKPPQGPASEDTEGSEEPPTKKRKTGGGKGGKKGLA